MQTFLPYSNFKKSAKVLDRQRLGKQRVEVLQILATLAGESDGWKNHPCVKMWKGKEIYLIEYGLAICEEWVNRGYKDTCRLKIALYKDIFKNNSKSPLWLGSYNFHRSHKSNLLRKNPDHYKKFFGSKIKSNLPYIWPI